MSRKSLCVCLLAVCLFALVARGHHLFASKPTRHAAPSRAVSSPLDSKSHANANTRSVPGQLAKRDFESAALRLPITAGGGTRDVANRPGKPFAIPFSFEPNVGQADPQAAFVGRGEGLTVLLEQREIAVQIDGASRAAASRKPVAPRTVSMRLTDAPRLSWQGSERLRGETNYLIGNDRRRWRTHVPHFAQAVAANAAPGVSVVVYGSDDGVEYDLRVAPGASLSRLRVKISGADAMSLAGNGDLVLKAGGAQLRMKKPAIYEEAPGAPARREPIRGGYVVEAKNTVGFRVGRRDPRATLVIDPSLSVGYASFLGGEGTDSAASVGLDDKGNVYVGGTTTSAVGFSETGDALGAGGGTPEFFIAKIEPTVNGPNSLVYLTFLGGSQQQSGGLVAVTSGGSVAITGATTSPDFPVTDGTRASSPPANDLAVSEIDPTGSILVFSTLLGGTGIESRDGNGGIALDTAGDVYVSSDTNITPLDSGSTDLPVTPNPGSGTGPAAYRVTWEGGGSTSDGFLAIYTPPAQVGGAATLKYCSYLGTAATGPASIGGVAVDSNTSPPSVYIAGTVGNPTTAFPFTNAFQTAYAGGDSDAFLMKISPQGQGSVDLVYASLLGGSGADEALGLAIDSNTPPSAYVTGMTSSTDFPTKMAFNANLNPSAVANAFLTVVGQAGNGQTSLLYSSYLGGSSLDQGQAVAVAAQNAVYVGGTTSSWDFPWHDNVQPFNGQAVAFVAKLDPTSSGAASLLYATPLGGTSSASDTSGAAGNAVATDAMGHVYLAGATTSPDFPTALTSSGQSLSGAQPTCASCWTSPPLADAFLVELQEGQAQQPALAFGQRYLNFLYSTAPQPTWVTNTGEAPLNIDNLAITGPDSGDFWLLPASPCASQSLNPGAFCEFEVGFSPSKTGYERAVVSVTDNAPGSPQQLELLGAAPGLAALPSSLAFPQQSAGSASEPQQVTFTVVIPTPGQTLTIDSAPSLGGANPGEFQLTPETPSCLLTASQASCTYNVVFLPQAPGSFRSEVDATFQVSGGSEQSLAVPITGTAVSSPAVSAPPSVNFGSQLAGTAGTPQPITVENSATGAGAGTLTFTGVSMSGANSGDFSITSDSCTSASTAGGQSCTIQVAFRPAQAAVCGTQSDRTATLALSDNAPGSPQMISLSGTAEDFCFSSPTGQAASEPISPGQTATYDLDVNSSQGFNGTVALACSGAPAEASCNLSASSVTVTATTAGSFSVSVPTTAPSSGFVPRGNGPTRAPRDPLALFAILAGIAMLGVASLLKRRFALVRAIQAGALLIVLGAGAAACGGGAASDPPDPGTPLGTYTITVTATVTVSSTTVTRTIPLTLTVN